MIRPRGARAMGNSAPANSALVPERPKGLLTSAECLKIAERKMGEAIGDRRHGKELRATAEAWLVLADKIEQAEALERLKAKGK
jgi:hypothetical protein